MWQTLIYNAVSNGLVTRVVFLVNADRMQWLAGYGCVVGAVKHLFDS